MADKRKARVFSGVQPSGGLHIGNYFGAIQRWAAEQNTHENIFCVVDLHAITVPQEPRVLQKRICETAAMLIAAGIDPTRSAIFVQSHLGGIHAELAWILNTLTPMGWLERMTQYKEKSLVNKERASAGLFDYPVLMAADILLYQTNLVPVGEDQAQHVELARDMAQRFNAKYGEVFTLPRAVLPDAGSRIMGLDNPAKKMSKSDASAGHAVGLLDPPDAVRAKIAQATTDSENIIRFDQNRPGIYNLLVIYERLTGKTRARIEEQFAGKGYAAFKAEVAEALIVGLEPLQKRFRELMTDQTAVQTFLREGAGRVRPIADETLRAVKERIGLG